MKLVHYKEFRFRKLNTPQFSHMILLLYWPIYYLIFQMEEQLFHPSRYFVMYCPLDDLIPFCEWFLIPYLSWFIYMAGSVFLTFFWNADVFRRLMRFIILTMTVCMVIYALFPTCQNLRPEEFSRDNPLTRFTTFVYNFDTNTNVCPSMHVLGSCASMLAIWQCIPREKKWLRFWDVAAAVLICVSTVFMKQHSILDVLAALPLCLIGGLLFFWPRSRFYFRPAGQEADA